MLGCHFIDSRFNYKLLLNQLLLIFGVLFICPLFFRALYQAHTGDAEEVNTFNPYNNG